jgi:peptidyl-prolyl cis-trans isomerase SurA
VARAASLPTPQARAEAREKALKGSLDNLIGEKLLESEMKELNIEVAESEVDMGIEDVRKQNGDMSLADLEHHLVGEGFTMESYRDFMRKHLRKLKLINLKVRNKVKVADEDLKAEYQKWVRLEEGDVEVHARHILIKVPEKAGPQEEVHARKMLIRVPEKAPAADVAAAEKKATALADEARKPGADFAALAKTKGEDPTAKDGGDLGFFSRGTQAPEVDRVAFALRAGQVSEPVKTKQGFVVIKVEERRTATAKSFDEQVEAARQRATLIAEEARKPGVDFADLAKAKSEGPTAADGGDLQFFKRGVMVPEFERVVFAMKPGDISDPIRTKLGFHVVKVEERRAIAVKSFDEMKEQLRDKMLKDQLEKYTDQYVQELRQAAVVEVKL